MKNSPLGRRAVLMQNLRNNRKAQDDDLKEIAKLNARVNTRRQQIIRDEAELATL